MTEEGVTEEPVAAAPAEEKSEIDTVFETFKSKLSEVRESELSKEDAVKELQPILNQFAAVTEKSIDPEAEKPVDAVTMRAAIRDEVKAIVPEITYLLRSVWFVFLR